MTDYREILRLDRFGINKISISASCSCSRNTVVSVLQRAKEVGLSYPDTEEMSNKQLSEKLFGQSVGLGVYP